jgi:hypothetical protein
MSTQDKVTLIIGMDEYQDKDLVRLDSCKKDAQDMSEMLSKLGYTIYGDSPLIGSKLDKEFGYTQVRKSIVKFFSSAMPNQTLLFYYSGHGIVWSDDVFLSTPQIDPSEPMDAGFSFTELTAAMKNSKSTRIVAIIDSCHAGAMGLSDSKLKGSADANAKLALAKYDQLSENVPKTEGKILLLSSQAYQPSEAIKGKNSLYTKFLLEGLNGVKFDKDPKGRSIDYTGSVDDNGRITPQLLHEYVYNKVATITNQVPRIKGDQSSKIVIAEIPELSNVFADAKLISMKTEKIRQMLADFLSNGTLKSRIQIKAQEIIDLEPNQISEKEKSYFDLLDRLSQKEIPLGKFVDSWEKVEQELNEVTKDKEEINKVDNELYKAEPHDSKTISIEQPHIILRGMKYDILGETDIGRKHETCDEICWRIGFSMPPKIAIEESKTSSFVSKHHLKIFRDRQGYFWIQDLGSKNGTAILKHDQYKLLKPGKKELLMDNSSIAICYNSSKGAYLTFTFHVR